MQIAFVVWKHNSIDGVMRGLLNVQAALKLSTMLVATASTLRGLVQHPISKVVLHVVFRSTFLCRTRLSTSCFNLALDSDRSLSAVVN